MLGIGLMLGLAARRGGGAAGPVLPASGLILDLNPASGVTPGTDASLSSSWVDASASGHTFVQATGGQKPTLRTGSPGYEAFDGARVMACDDILRAPLSAMTLAFRFRLNAVTSVGMVLQSFFSAKQTTTEFIEVAFMNSGGYKSISWAFNAGSVTAVGIDWTQETAADHDLIITYNGGAVDAPASYTATFDGVAATVAASSAFARAGDNGSIGSRVNAGTLQFPANMRFYRAAAWNRVLSGGEIATVHTVLST